MYIEIVKYTLMYAYMTKYTIKINSFFNIFLIVHLGSFKYINTLNTLIY